MSEQPTTLTDDVTTDPEAGRRKTPRRRHAVAGALAGVLLLGGTAGALGAHALTGTDRTTATRSTAQGYPGSYGGTGYGSYGDTDPYGFSGGPDSFGQSPQSSDGTSTTSTATAATAAQKVGVVTIDTVLKYESAEAAGTGIVLTSNGEILTNNHVVAGATSIKVTVESTGRTYTATVVGTDATDDIAVLQLQGASGLTTAKLASSAASTGDSVIAIGNAGGTGDLTTAAGSVTALDQTITTEAEGSASSETLHGLIETDADIISGDSGGPLVNSSGAVVGIDTAATSGTSEVTGYAITIAKALSIADQITSGQDTAAITLGTPAFLGVQLSESSAEASSGATITGTITGTPAAEAGLTAGDTITAVDGNTVTSSSRLSALLATYAPRDRVRITYTNDAGTSATVQVQLIAGPAD